VAGRAGARHATLLGATAQADTSAPGEAGWPTPSGPGGGANAIASAITAAMTTVAANTT
jgi:hypothetical protein